VETSRIESRKAVSSSEQVPDCGGNVSFARWNATLSKMVRRELVFRFIGESATGRKVPVDSSSIYVVRDVVKANAP
jgi:hypothetical protein